MIIGHVDTEKSEALLQALIIAFNTHVKENKVNVGEIGTAMNRFHVIVINDLEKRTGNKFIKNVAINALMEAFSGKQFPQMGQPQEEQMP